MPARASWHRLTNAIKKTIKQITNQQLYDHTKKMTYVLRKFEEEYMQKKDTIHRLYNPLKISINKLLFIEKY